MSLPVDRQPRGVAGMLRSLRRERDEIRLRAVIGGLALAGIGLVAEILFADRVGSFGVALLVVGGVKVWEGYFGEAPIWVRGPQPISDEQRAVLTETIEREGRDAAVRQLKMWTGSTHAEATADIDAAFPAPGFGGSGRGL